MADPLESRGVNGSMALTGPSGLQLPFELPGKSGIQCRPSINAATWCGELPQRGISLSELSPTFLASFICMGSWNSLVGIINRSPQLSFGETFLRRSGARKCLRCGKVRVHRFTSPSTSPRNSASSSLSEARA